MRVFKTREFTRFASRERIDDHELCDAATRADRGLVDANLGGGVIKQRVARQGQGRSGGYRTIIAFRSGLRSVFMYGFAKNKKANLSDPELAVYRELATMFLGSNDSALVRMLIEGELVEFVCDDQEV